MHSHKVNPEKTVTLPFMGPVVLRQNEAAHGGIRLREFCQCGAHRDTNANGSHRERGPWVTPSLFAEEVDA